MSGISLQAWIGAFATLVSVPALLAQSAIEIRNIDLSRSFAADSPLPKWENGYLIGIDSINSPIPKVYSYGTAGAKLFEVSLGIDQAVRIMTNSVAASSEGIFAVSGSAYSNSGDGALFIALLNVKGELVRLIRTGNFSALRLCFADNGSLIAAGRLVNFPPNENPVDHDILRIYKSDGTLQSSTLPRSSFASHSRRSHPARLAQIASNGKLVAFLSVDSRELVTLGADGAIHHRTTFPPLGSGDLTVTGFAVAPDSTIYLSCQVALGPDPKKVSVVYYRLDLWKRRLEIYSGCKLCVRV